MAEHERYVKVSLSSRLWAAEDPRPWWVYVTDDGYGARRRAEKIGRFPSAAEANTAAYEEAKKRGIEVDLFVTESATGKPGRRRRGRPNPDLRLRELERAALAGGEQEQQAYKAALTRRGLCARCALEIPEGSCPGSDKQGNRYCELCASLNELDLFNAEPAHYMGYVSLPRDEWLNQEPDLAAQYQNHYTVSTFLGFPLVLVTRDIVNVCSEPGSVCATGRIAIAAAERFYWWGVDRWGRPWRSWNAGAGMHTNMRINLTTIRRTGSTNAKGIVETNPRFAHWVDLLLNTGILARMQHNWTRLHVGGGGLHGDNHPEVARYELDASLSELRRRRWPPPPMEGE